MYLSLSNTSTTFNVTAHSSLCCCGWPYIFCSSTQSGNNNNIITMSWTRFIVQRIFRILKISGFPPRRRNWLHPVKWNRIHHPSYIYSKIYPDGFMYVLFFTVGRFISYAHIILLCTRLQSCQVASGIIIGNFYCPS